MKTLKKTIGIILIIFICFNILNITLSNANSENINVDNKTDKQEVLEEKDTNKLEEQKEQQDIDIEKTQNKEQTNSQIVSTKIDDKENNSTQTIEDGYYQISTALASNKVIDVESASKDNGANIHIWGNVNQKQQKFKITYIGDGYYTIQNYLSKKMLDVANGNAKNGANVWQYESNGTKAQKWIIKDCGDGYFNIISAYDDYCLDVSNASTTNGTNVQIYEKNGTNAQKFKFIKADVIIGEKTIEDGYYQICTALNSNKVLDVENASKDNGANIHIWGNVNQKQQKFKITYIGDGYYTIQNFLSKKMLDVANGNRTNGNNVWQYESNGSIAQKWIIKDCGDGYYNVITSEDELYLDVSNAGTANGTNIQIYEGNGTKAQKFKFIKTDVIIGERTIEDGYYQINTALASNKVIDVESASRENGANIHIWDNIDKKQQKFKITYIGNGYYTIKNVLSQKLLDVEWGNAKNGANVWQYGNNGTDSQKWIIKDCGDGYYNIISALDDYYLDVSNASTTNGTNIHIYEQNGTKAQKFKFIKTNAIEPIKSIDSGVYKISIFKDPNMVLDIAGASTENSANVQIWSYQNVLQQKFRVEYLNNGYYTIKCIKSNKVLDVANGIATNGNNVWQYESNGTEAQQWIIKDCGDGYYNIVSACNDMFLDVYGGYTSCGTNIQIYEGNNTNAQKFKFEPVTAIELEEGTYGSSGLKVKGDGRGQSLKYYKIGNGPNVFFATFAVHGWEDLYAYDGQALTQIAESFKNKLLEMQDESLANKWTIYIFPSVNPDGEYYGYTNNGPGRTSLYSAAPSNKGIDINRCWSTGYKINTSNRNYTGTTAFQSYEAQALRDFLLSHRATNGQTILVDLHGWLNETIGDYGIGSYYRNQFGISKHIGTYGNGYLVNWARTNLGYNGRVARSCLVELPEYNADSNRYINATINMLRSII